MRALGVSVSRRLTTPNQENQNNPSTSTPTRTRPLRHPLQARDENAMIARVPPKAKASQPLASKTGNAKMPFDKQNAPSRPLLPALSATAKSSRPPITPRVAGSNPSTTSTPVARKGARTERSERNSTPTGPREDLPIPNSSYLSNNVTPRSGSRKSRVDSPAGTPTSTPTPQFAADAPRMAPDPMGNSSGLGINVLEKDGPRRPNVTFSSDIGYQNSSSQVTGDSKFFFASEAKSGAQTSSRPALQKQSSSSFFYANGDSIPPPPRSAGSAVGSSIGDDAGQAKFFHANGTPDIVTSPSPQYSAPRSTVSSSSCITSPRLAPANTIPLIPHQRPSSPQKLSQHSTGASQKNAPGRTSPAFNRTTPTAATRVKPAQGSVAARRASIESAQRTLGHGRSSSIGSTEVRTPPTRKISYGESQVLSPSGAFALSPVSASTPEENQEEIVDAPRNEMSPEMESQTKAGHSIEHLNELAANARRERKVLDLEITNSSLEAINRTLEREMRKQTAELRRYRRLSRSGRLSINTSTSMRTSADSLSIMGVLEGGQLSDMSEEEFFSEEDEISEEESADDASLSSAAMAESDARHRSKDEKRLQLDLSKHQQLLVDSQKMNQSLKRCLGWTEELIAEGRKALEYHVRVSDVELGGRVLAPEYTTELAGDDHEVTEGLASPLLREVMKAAAWGDGGKDDRDSGIELNPETGLQRGPS